MMARMARQKKWRVMALHGAYDALARRYMARKHVLARMVRKACIGAYGAPFSRLPYSAVPIITRRFVCPSVRHHTNLQMNLLS